MTDRSHKPGKVALVGAGPGDEGLLTLRGKEWLERADIVIYDHLANERLLRFGARPELFAALQELDGRVRCATCTLDVHYRGSRLRKDTVIAPPATAEQDHGQVTMVTE